MKNAYITPANITLATNFNFKCLRATTGKRIENVSLTESGLT